jgi:hypothetical protein
MLRTQSAVDTAPGPSVSKAGHRKRSSPKGKRRGKYKHREPLETPLKSEYIAPTGETVVKFQTMTSLEINAWFYAAKFATAANGYRATVVHQRAADELGYNVDTVSAAFRSLVGLELLERIEGGVRGVASVYRVCGTHHFEDSEK